MKRSALLLILALLQYFTFVLASTDADHETTVVKLVDADADVTVIGRQVLVNARWPIWQFRGIPYAEPPIGDLRFRRPKPKRYDSLDAPVVIDASTDETRACIGIKLDRNSYIDDIEMGSNRYRVWDSVSEDCLYLNVWTQSVKTGNGKSDDGNGKNDDGNGKNDSDEKAQRGNEGESTSALAPVLVEVHGGKRVH